MADDTGRTPLHIAVLANKSEIVDLLLNNGADANIKDANRKTALQYSLDNVSQNLIELYLIIIFGIEFQELH